MNQTFLFKRVFSSSSIRLVPKKYKLPAKYKDVTFPEGWDKTPKFKRIVKPQIPTSEALAAPSITMKQYLASLPRKTQLLSDVSSLSENIESKTTPMTLSEHNGSYTYSVSELRFKPRIPLPTTFARRETHKTWLNAQNAEPAPLTTDPNYFPYRYYEVTMIRGLIGLPEKLKRLSQCIGLQVVNQLVYLEVNEKNATKLLKMKELIRVRLVNDIPEPIQTVAGFKKIGNVIGKTIDDMI